MLAATAKNQTEQIWNCIARECGGGEYNFCEWMNGTANCISVNTQVMYSDTSHSHAIMYAFHGKNCQM